jgi:molybdopterin-guanine dinucleotide biosynthesis protein A
VTASAAAAVGVGVGVILAGGRAERLGGQPKGLLRVGGRRIIDCQLEALRAVFPHVFLVANDPAPWTDLGLLIVPDRVPAAGPLAGLDAALAALALDEPAAVCVAGDMPFLTPAILTLLRDHAPEAAAVVPRVAGRPDPLCARYHRRCAGEIARALAEGRFKTAALLDHLEVSYLDEPALRALDPTLRFLTNVNTPEDLQQIGR